MLVIGGAIRIDPAHRDKVIAAALEMMEDTRKEPGCEAYVMSADLSDPGCFHIFERWESQDALERHFRSEHMARFQAAAGQLGIRSMDVHRYEVASMGPVV